MEQIRKQEGAFSGYLKYLSSVGLVSAITSTVTAPLERFKLIQQAQNVLTVNERYKFKSFAQYVSRVPKEQGFRAFFRGNLANIFNIVPKAGAQFIFFDNVQRTFFPQGEAVQSGGQFLLNKFLCAMSCGALSLLFTYPLDTVRVRLALEFAKKKENRTFQSVFQTLGEIRSSQGVGQLYRGFLLSNFTNFHYFISLYTIIDVLKNAETREYLNQDVSNVLNYVGFSQVGALFAMASVYPLDTIRRRLQQTGYNRSPNLKYKNTLDCFNKIRQMEGLGALYKGLGSATVKFGIASSLQVFLLTELINNKVVTF